MKTIILLFAILFGMLLGIFLLQNPSNRSALFGKNPKVTIDNKTFNVTVAKTSQQKEIGLSETEKLDENQGMLFPFDHPDFYGFWMKNMKFPIDIIYINNGKIVTIYSNVQPPKYSTDLPIYQPKSAADSVLEINAGLSSKDGLKEGDSISASNIN